MDLKEIIKWVAIATGAYLVYTYVIVPMTSGATTAAASTTPASTSTAGTLPSATGTTTTTTTSNSTLNVPNGSIFNSTPAAPGTNAAVNNTFSSPDYGTQAWLTRVSTAMVGAAGNGNQNFDNWAYYYQNSVGGSPISPNLMNNIIAQGGGNRAALITAPMFLGYLVAAGTANGLSGVGEIVYTGAGLAGLGSFYRM